MTKNLRVALVHDYLNEFGGAERVLLALAEMYPEAPIYTAFVQPKSPAARMFSGRDIRESWAAKIPGFRSTLHSPLRFLAPEIWESFDLDAYEVVISSASWYITKGVITHPDQLHVCYCHTPPRYLYGLPTAREWQKYWLVRQYARVVNGYLRRYDFAAAQRPDVLVANSTTVQRRISHYYQRESVVIYPPVTVDVPELTSRQRGKKTYFLTGGRLVGAKHFSVVVEAAKRLDVPLKVFGEGRLRGRLEEMAGSKVEFVGRVGDAELARLYAGAIAFVALAEDEDFGITPVEAMAAGTPVLAYSGGGYVETVVDGTTGLFVKKITVAAVAQGMKTIRDMRFKRAALEKRARQFSKQRFVTEMGTLVDREWKRVQKRSA